ncbi:MAG: hypothetical protein COB67_11495 [SAR324 cluster bacterium]|uniref:Porin n=1 Tax=SAR324 cluster bacterium TaxID=2024889 RepID=A0A2A4STZ5_9DELT|nr:MAG: hypothetical protein COB67_11495 [SAR324 cluster bacterium]
MYKKFIKVILPVGVAMSLATPVFAEVQVYGSAATFFGVGSSGDVLDEQSKYSAEEVHFMSANIGHIKMDASKGGLSGHMAMKVNDNRSVKKNDILVKYKTGAFQMRLGTNNPLEGNNFTRGAMVAAPVVSRYETNTARVKGDGLGIRYQVTSDINAGFTVYSENRIAPNMGRAAYKNGTAVQAGALGAFGDLKFRVSVASGKKTSFNGTDTFASASSHLGLQYAMGSMLFSADIAMASQEMPANAFGEDVKAEANDLSAQFLMRKLGPGNFVLTLAQVTNKRTRTDTKIETYNNLVYTYPLEKGVDLHLAYTSNTRTYKNKDEISTNAIGSSVAHFTGIGLRIVF